MTMAVPACLLLVALLCNYVPEVAVALHGGSMAAWFVVADNLQIAALWWAVGHLAELFAQYEPERRVFLLPTLAVCAYGIFEAVQVPACRLAFPMDAPPPKHPEGVCGAAGLPTYELSPLLIALCAVILARTLPAVAAVRPYRA